MKIQFTVINHHPDTIYNRLVSRLGRVPTSQELRAEVARIIAGRGPLTPGGVHER